MKLIRGLQNLDKHNNGCAITVGNFDGVHIGHQKIISRVVARAKKLKLKSVVISFVPTPQDFFGNNQSTLSNFKEKHNLLESLGLDEHLLIKFNKEFSQISAQEFVQKILIDKLNIKYCLIGDDFRFGAGRLGDFKMLKSLSSKYGFNVDNTESILCNDCRASSSKIRELLTIGGFKSASQMLGREFSISGKIIYGQQKGRTIGFPTINISIKRKISPVLGVFAVNVELDGSLLNGVCNIGKRPTVGGQKTLLEVFLFNFDKQVYGKNAKVVFKHKIRDEKKFNSFSELKKQIELDSKIARNYFSI